MAALQNGILQLRNGALKNVFPIVAAICTRNIAELRTMHGEHGSQFSYNFPQAAKAALDCLMLYCISCYELNNIAEIFLKLSLY